MSKIFLYFFTLLRSIVFCFQKLPFKIALKCPILVSPFVKIKSNKGDIKIECSNITFGMIKIGLGDAGIFDSIFSRTIWQIDGCVKFKGNNVLIGHGSKISVGKEGELEIGENFTITAESSIVCHYKIKFGNNILISWENLFLDTDFHQIYNFKNKELINPNKSIVIGNNVWIGCRNTILKGTCINDNCIIGSNSLVNKKIKETNVILAGNPVKIVKENIYWKK